MAARSLLFSALAVLACSPGWHPLDSSVLAQRRAQSILVARADPPELDVLTPGSAAAVAALPPMGFAIWRGHVDSLAQRGIVDPGPRIAGQLVAALARKYGLRTDPPRDYGRDLAVSRHWNVDLVLAVRTESWRLRGFAVPAANPSRPASSRITAPVVEDHCRMEYEATLELRDARSGRALATGRCVPPVLVPAASPRWDAAMADGARLLKADLDRMVAYCVRGYAQKLLGLSAREMDEPVGAPAVPGAPL